MGRLKYIILVLLIPSICFAGPQATSSTTGTNLIAQARIYLDEPSTSIVRWTEAELLQYLNDGTVDIAAQTGCYQGSESITLGANTIEYSPSTSYLSVVGVVINPASGTKWGLIKGSIRSIGAQVGVSVPTYWYEFAGKIGIYPAYTAVTTETATAYFVKRPAAIAAGGTVPTPAALDNALVYYITAQALLKDRRPQEAGNYLAWYQKELNQYRQDLSEVDNETVDPVR